MSQAQQGEAPQPPLPPRIPFIHNAALAGAFITPAVMLLPPRKLDIRFFVLAGTFSLCTNQLAYEYTGRSIYNRFGSRVGSIFDTSLPEGAKRTQQLLREQREREAAQRQKDDKAAATIQASKGNKLNDIWMGGESEDWRQKRAEEHQKGFDEGKGMSDLIMEQVADVWNGRWGNQPKKDGVDASTTETQSPEKK